VIKTAWVNIKGLNSFGEVTGGSMTLLAPSLLLGVGAAFSNTSTVNIRCKNVILKMNLFLDQLEVPRSTASLQIALIRYATGGDHYTEWPECAGLVLTRGADGTFHRIGLATGRVDTELEDFFLNGHLKMSCLARDQAWSNYIESIPKKTFVIV
jgi:hypothetical protein